MGGFTEEMRGRLPPGMRLPEPIAALFDWIEARGFLSPSARFEGDRLGTLQALTPPGPGTVVLFRVETQAQAAENAGGFVDAPRRRRRSGSCPSPAPAATVPTPRSGWTTRARSMSCISGPRA